MNDDWERRLINGHDLSLREMDWRCLTCGHWFEAANDANGWPCGESCTGRHYRNAPSGLGPLARAWDDKPHRLLYDLAAGSMAEVDDSSWPSYCVDRTCKLSGPTHLHAPSPGRPA